jgi:uncharacterized phage-associated protein
MRDHSFSPQRALESILFLATRLVEKRLTAAPTIHQLLKLRYFADKRHLSAYGFVASGDDYSALEFGPVASETYSMLKAARGEQDPWIDPSYAALMRDAVEIRNTKYVHALRAPNVDLLSRADVECLEHVVDEFGRLSFRELTARSHDDAWSKAWDVAAARGAVAERMRPTDIAGTLDNAPQVLDYMRA